jgi:hypothetical protein
MQGLSEARDLDCSVTSCMGKMHSSWPGFHVLQTQLLGTAL